MQILNVTNLPIYLPYDVSHVPFGDPLEGITCTSAAPGVITAPGYDNPQAGDQVALTYTTGGSMPTGLTYGQAYYVVSPSGDTFSLAATKGGSAITTTSTGANLVLHLLSGEVDGVTLPFKPTGSVVVENNSGGTLVLQGANDANAGVGPPQGPGSWNTIVSLTTGAQANAQLLYDWIRVSSAGTLTLQQN
jgi:hypothetical protein